MAAALEKVVTSHITWLVLVMPAYFVFGAPSVALVGLGVGLGILTSCYALGKPRVKPVYQYSIRSGLAAITLIAVTLSVVQYSTWQTEPLEARRIRSLGGRVKMWPPKQIWPMYRSGEVRALSLTGVDVEATELTRLVTRCRHLESLDLSNNPQIADTLLGQIPLAGRFAELRELDISNTGISDAALRNGPIPSSLQRLSLANNPISDKTIAHFVLLARRDAKQFQDLQSLDLRGTDVAIQISSSE